MTAHSLSACGRGVCGCAVGQVSICHVGPAGRRRLIQLVMQAQHGLATRGLGGPHALAERAGSRVAHIPRAEGAVAEEGRGPLVALLLEALLDLKLEWPVPSFDIEAEKKRVAAC